MTNANLFRGRPRAGSRRATTWLAAGSGDLKRAPKRLGGIGFRACAKAPGTYVHAA